MKRTFCKRLKKSISAILAAAMSLSLFTTIPASAEIGTTTYNYDGYSVDYNITNEWDGTQIVDITVSNTGTESILNWALKYDAEGEISNLWNAAVYEQNGDEYVIKNIDWNFEIAPSQSVTYGYTLSGSDLSVPKSFEIYSKRVDKTEGYDVQYNITNEWETGVEGNIVITNLSNAPIEAWTLSFDSNFTIEHLWDGRVLENNGTSYTIAAEIWTNPIQPNSSMTIGFVGTKAADIEATLDNFRLTEVVIGAGGGTTSPVDPPVEQLEITANAVYDEESGNITITWENNNPEGTFDILMSADGENFVSVGTVKDVSEFVYIPESDFETLYFKVVQTVDEQTTESNVVAVASDAEAIVIIDEAFYNDNTIIIKWTSNVPDGNFEILMSEDKENFISVGKIENASEYAYTYENDFNILYFKVIQTTGLRTAESNLAKILFYIDWEDITDTDGDELPDVYEKYRYNTDPGNPDTDGDGLPDGFEVYYLGTDPTKEDTDENGISDGDEDLDKDNLSNLREYELGTNPRVSDSDYDGLTDSEEVDVYNTDPLKYDTDEDGISDGDEIALSLDPNNMSTNGTPDSERTFEQHIGVESEVFSEVNTNENPFKVSMDITAGVAENNLYSQKSSYSNIMKNNAIIGIAPEFFYAYDLEIDDITINFDLDRSITDNTNGKYTSVSDEFVGIKRFNIFRYFEGKNMLLPVETFHDVENNRVYANVDELGTYCLIDMEIWLESLGIEPKVAEPKTIIKNSDGNNLDIIFIIYSNSTHYKYLKADLTTAVTDIFNEAEKRNINAEFIL